MSKWLALLPLLLLAASLGVGSAKAEPAPLCVVIDDAGHCAPAGLFSPSTAIDTGAVAETGFDATGCKWRHTNHGWSAGSLGFKHQFNVYLRWCTSNGLVRKYTYGISWTGTGPLCHETSYSTHLDSGGIGTGHIDRNFAVYYSCGMPWGGGYSTSLWFDSRVTGTGTAWIFNWKGRS